MLYLIGLGLDKNDISVKALSLIKKCKQVYLEYYTSDFPYSVKELEKILGKKITTVDRDFVEEAETLVLKAKSKNVALLVYGDPLIATTHTALLQEAKKMKVKTEIVHNISVLNAITDTGLEAYKFGKITSIPKYTKNFKPTSFINVYKENQKINAHTLFLIDIGMELNEAVSQLGLAKNTKIIACSCLGTSKQKIIYADAEKLSRKKMQKPFCIIIPAKLHFAESEFLKRYE
ncbi:MAG: diphthine synthase [Nanoarchaeota archaeon]|nr:diphthine synthase [Nanoarchaeota archaeon]